MNSIRSVVKWLIACGAMVAIAFVVGESMGQRKMLSVMSVQLASVQTSLAFNRLANEREWTTLLARGCNAQAAKALDIAEDKDMELLAGLFNEKPDAAAIKYVSDRDPLLIGQLKAFKSKYGSRWSVDECRG